MESLIKSKVEPGRVAIRWLGQGGFAFKNGEGDVLVTDPYLSDSLNTNGEAARLTDIPIKPKDVRLDYLFLTPRPRGPHGPAHRARHCPGQPRSAHCLPALRLPAPC